LGLTGGVQELAVDVEAATFDTTAQSCWVRWKGWEGMDGERG
jgi:hypothetical protein